MTYEEKLNNTYEIFDEYEKRFAQARLNHRLRKPWLDTDRAEILQNVKDVLCLDKIPIPEIKIINETKEEISSVSVTHCMYRSWENFYGNYSLFSPGLEGKRPLIFICPGHGADGRLTKSYQMMALRLAKMGAYVIINENIGQGSREPLGHRNTIAPFYCGLTLQGMIIAETMALINFAKEFDFVDKTQIGACGNSGGGTLTMFLSALEPSLSAVAACGYPSEFPYLLQKERPHCACNILNHFSGKLEMWEVLSLCAPKALMIEQGENDHLIPVDYFMRTARKVKTVYSMLDKEEKFIRTHTPTTHPWAIDDIDVVSEFFKAHFDLNSSDEDITQAMLIPVDRNNVTYPEDFITTDELAQKLTGITMPKGTEFEDVFVPTYKGKPIKREEITEDLGRGDVMHVFAQFEASL